MPIALWLGLAWATVWSGCEAPPSTRLESVPQPHVRVATVELVAPRPQSRHLVPLVPYRRARLAPRSGGEVVKLAADEEQEVREGDVLVRFAAEDPRGGLMSARAGISRIEESLRDNARELETARSLVERGVETHRALERLETERAVLQAQLRENEGNLVRARDRIGATSLIAPFPGTITAVEVELGEYVAPGATAIILAQLDPIAVEVPLTQREVVMADEGGLRFEVVARGESLAPTLEWLASESLAGTTTFPARLDLPNPGNKLRAGELVEVHVYAVDASAEVKAVPATAVRWSAEQAYLLRIAEDGTLSRIDVAVLDDTHERVVVEGDVSPGDRVVASGPIALVAGDKVTVVDDDAEIVAAR